VTQAVVLEGLTRSFGAVHAVKDLSFGVTQGELFGLVGPDGAGKTTTLRMLAGVLRPTRGDARVLNLSVARQPEAVKDHIAYMSQRFGLYTDLTVAENLAFYADLYQVPKADRPARLERLYAFSGLKPFRDRLAGQLSGGMKQKLGLSCALVHHPAVLLLDEPTFGVDPISRRDLWLIVHEMVADGMTVVVSTAYLDEAERCDRVALLHEGTMIALDTPEMLQSSLRGQIIAVLTDAPRRARDILQAHPTVRRAALFGETVHATFADLTEQWPAARDALRQANLEILSQTPVAPSLEDVFIDLVEAGSTR
jgi:ABC-2 type transport system ATP-binding protein